MPNPFSDINKKPLTAREAVISKKLAQSYTLIKAKKTLKNLLTPSSQRRLLAQTRKYHLWINPDKVRQIAEKEFYNILKFREFKRPPPNRWVLLKSGPFEGQWRRVIEQKDLFSQAIYQFVVSSNLSAIAYDPRTREMEIEFKGGAVYRYFNVPKRVYTGLLNSGSHGKYFWRYVRGLGGKSRGLEPIYRYSRLRFRKEKKKVPGYLKKK